jgi:putative transposase
MPRHARLRIGGLPLHVIQRGVNRCACFGDESDYGVYLALLEELSTRYECAMHAYVLMTNHVHLLVTPPEPDGASKLMKHLGQRYVQYFNRRHKRTGSLWEGRFRSSLIDSEGYLMRCHRYVEMNPVRAGMVQRPSDYRWSSHGSNESLQRVLRRRVSHGVDGRPRIRTQA